MDHINDIELTEFIAGRLAASRSEEINEHIAGCPKCSERRQEAAKLWEMLGQWDVDTTGHDIAGRVLASTKNSQPFHGQDDQTQIIKGDLWVDVLRIAASVIIAVGVGQKLGKLSTGQTMPPAAPSQTVPRYIAALGLEWSSELTWLIMDEQSPEQEKQ
jgi:anti-sigma factor RsiW